MKQQTLRMRKRMITLLVIAAVLLTALFSMGFTLVSADSYVADYDKFEEFTQDDDVEGVDSFTVKDYIARVKSYGYSNDVALQSQHLYGIIPEELFHNEGTWFYKGYDYSFRVETGESMVATARYVSEVVIVDHNFSVDENSAMIDLGVSLFTQAYNTILLNDGSWRSDLGGPTSRDYYLKNVKFTTVIENEHEKNYGDDGYSMYEDGGLVIANSRVNYKGLYKEENTYSIVPLAAAGLSYAIGKIPILDTAVAIYDQFKMNISIFNSILAGFEERTEEVSNGNDKEIIVFDSKEAQRNDPQLAGYARAVELSPASGNPNLYIDDYAEMHTQLNNSDNETRINAMIGFYLYVDDGQDSYIIGEDGEPSDVVNMFEFKAQKYYYSYLAYERGDEAESGENEGYLLREDSVQEFEYSPDKNSNYTVSAGTDKLVQVVAPNGTGTAWQPSISYKFITNNYYQINVKKGSSFTAGSYTLSIDFTPDNAILGSNSVMFSNTDREYLTLSLPQNNYYRFICSEPGVTMYIRDSLFEEAYDSGQDVRINKNSSEIFYVEIYSEQKLTKTITIQCYKEKDLVYYTNTVEGVFTQPIRAGVSYTLPEPSITPTNMAFDGWWTTENFAEGTQIDDDTIEEVWDIASSSIDLYAKWIPVSVEPDTYTIYLNNEGVITEQPVTYGEYLSGVSTPTKKGHTFNGWYDGETLVINSNGVLVDENGNSCAWSYENDLYLFADFTVNTYKISYPTSQSMQVQYGSTVILPTDVRIGFDGYWKFEGLEVPMGTTIVYTYDYDISLTPIWREATYTLTLMHNDGGTGKTIIEFNYGEMPLITAPGNFGYMAVGATKYANGTGTSYFIGERTPEGNYYVAKLRATNQFNFSEDTTLYIKWELLRLNYTIPYYDLSMPFDQQVAIDHQTVTIVHGQEQSITAPNEDPENYIFDHILINNVKYTNKSVTYTFNLMMDASTGENVITYYPNNSIGFIHIYYKPKDGCIAAGTLITLADGTQKSVEELTGNESLLVWNMQTGTFDSAPILFIDSESCAVYEVIYLYFSDGTIVKVISEHGFWDIELNKYVYLDKNADDYIGHWFKKQGVNANGEMIWENVQLVNVVIRQESTTCYSPVTYSHLCYFVNGMLSMPGGIDGLFNIFDVDAETMMIDMEAFNADIALYGLFTYDEFAQSYPVTESVFEAFNAQYFKVAIGKGMLDENRLLQLIERYSVFFEDI